MVGMPGRVVSSRGSRVQIELMNSGQIVDLTSSDRFFIGDPVVVASENGKIAGFTRASKVMQKSTKEYAVGLGEYWARGKQ